MKKLVFTIALIGSMQFAQAQVTTPKASPAAEVEQVVGLTKVEVDYSRPAKNNRSVFGDLVPYGRLWRTGANDNTVVEFSDDVKVLGNTVPKGKYAIFTVPSPNEWKIIFYKDVNNWGAPKELDPAKVALTTSVPTKGLESEVEYFSIQIDPISSSKGALVFKWEKTMASLEFEVPTHDKAMSSIKSLNDTSKATDFYAAGQYLFSSGTDDKMALDYINKAIAMQEDAPFYMLRVKSVVQAKLGDKKGAIETANLSMKKAQAAQNDDYVKMNKDSILEWSK